MTIFDGCRLPHLCAIAALALPLSWPSMAGAAGASRVHDCENGLKMEVFEPRDGVMEAHVDDLIVQISVTEQREPSPAYYDIRLAHRAENPSRFFSSTSTRESGEILSNGCWLVAQYYRNLKEPSAEILRKQLEDLYGGL